jgi:plasmid stabilization system protein ParE
MAIRTVRFHRLALDDFRKAIHWYRKESAYAATGFAPAVFEAADRIALAAESYPLAAVDVRWVRVKGYPYVLYYMILDDLHCRVISVAHVRRRPRFWVRRLKSP